MKKRDKLNKIITKEIISVLSEQNPKSLNESDTKKFIKMVKDEWDMESLELMKTIIDDRILFVNKMISMGTRKVVKGFRK